MSARNDFLAALRALLPPASDGTVSVVRAGELVTVSLTLPGREKPITTATVRTAQKASAAQGDLFEPRPEGAPEAPSTPAAPDTPTPVVVVGATTAEAALAIPPITQAGRELRVGDRVFVDGDERIWTVYLYIEDRVSLVDGDSKTTCSLAREDITLSPGGVWCCASLELVDETPAGHLAGVSQVSEGHLAGVSETPDGDPQKSPWTLFSVEVPDSHENAQAWALVKGLAWCCGGYLLWHIEGGASRRSRHRMVAIVPREKAIELFDLCADARLTPDMLDVDHGDSLLRVGSRVRRESGAPWLVASIDRSTRRATLECGGATIAPDVAEIETTTDGSGDFVLALLSTAPSKASTPKGDAKLPKKAAKGATSPKANPSKIPAGYVELRVETSVYAKHRKGLLALSAQPLGGVWREAPPLPAPLDEDDDDNATRAA